MNYVPYNLLNFADMRKLSSARAACAEDKKDTKHPLLEHFQSPF